MTSFHLLNRETDLQPRLQISRKTSKDSYKMATEHHIAQVTLFTIALCLISKVLTAPIDELDDHSSTPVNRNTIRHIDVTVDSGVYLNAEDNSQVFINHFKFPNISSKVRTNSSSLKISFQTSSTDGVIFYGESHKQMHRVEAYISKSQLRVRITGSCHWLYLRDLVHDTLNISDSKFHQLKLITNDTGIFMQLDSEPERQFYYASSNTFKCWHIDQLYLGLPELDEVVIERKHNRQLKTRINGCIKNFHIETDSTTHQPETLKDFFLNEVEITPNNEQLTAETYQPSIVYRRVSSCHHQKQERIRGWKLL